MQQPQVSQVSQDFLNDEPDDVEIDMTDSYTWGDFVNGVQLSKTKTEYLNRVTLS